jgi:hypothetical protein
LYIDLAHGTKPDPDERQTSQPALCEWGFWTASFGPLMVEPIEYEVMSVVIASRLPPKATGLIVVRQEPSVESHLSDLPAYDRFGVFQKIPSIEKEAVLDLLVKEKNASHFRSSFSLPRSVYLLGEQEAKKVFRGRADWTSFYEAFPESGGVFFLSRVGFTQSQGQAVVHVGRQWLGRAGGGEFVVLEKVDAKFREVSSVSTWLS